MSSLTLFTPSGVVPKAALVRLAAQRLAGLGFQVAVDSDANARQQRFGGSDATRLAALHRVALAAPSVAMATRGGYGLTRLLDGIDWPLLARSVEQGTRWVGHSDFTALQLGLLAHTGAIAKFQHARQVVKLAGANPSRRETGVRTGGPSPMTCHCGLWKVAFTPSRSSLPSAGSVLLLAEPR